MGKGPFSFRRPTIRRRHKKPAPGQPQSSSSQQVTGGGAGSPINNDNSNVVYNGSTAGGGPVAKAKKKTGGARLWMRFDRSGQSELVEWDKNAIIRRAAIPTRDLRILGPVFSHSSNILGNELAFCFQINRSI